MLPWAAPYCYAAALPSVTAGGGFGDIVFNLLAVFSTDQSMSIENKLTKQHQSIELLKCALWQFDYEIIHENTHPHIW